MANAVNLAFDEVICPADCTTGDLPTVQFDLCNPEINLSEIQKIYVGKANAAAFTDVTSAAEWTGRLSQTATGDKLRTLTVIGDKPAPQSNSKDISLGRKVITQKDHTLNATIDETNETNYGMLRYFECNTQVRIWFETAGGKLYGGNEGILVSVVIDLVLDRGSDAFAVFNAVFTWKSKFSPAVVDSPLAA